MDGPDHIATPSLSGESSLLHLGRAGRHMLMFGSRHVALVEAAKVALGVIPTHMSMSVSGI